jgi:hypothetical protein
MGEAERRSRRKEERSSDGEREGHIENKRLRK